MAEDGTKPDYEELCKELRKQLDDVQKQRDDLQKKHDDLHAEHNCLQKQHADLKKRLDDLQNNGQPEATKQSSEEATEKSSEVISVLEHVVMSSGHLLRFCPSGLDNVVRRQEARETEETTCGSK